jgi:hypothetical protein
VSKSVFLIHGRDLRARDQMVKFIGCLGLTDLDFDTLATLVGPAPTIRDVVLKGISTADAVIALFTPDEVAALYSPDSDSLGLWRWQSRPNVIFEAGVALGLASAHTTADGSEPKGEKTILVTLGPDVEMFSDLSGIQYVRIDFPDGKNILRKKLEALVGPIDLQPGWADSSTSGDFQIWSAPLWAHYDELNVLENKLGAKQVGAERMSLLDLLKTVSSQCSLPLGDNLSTRGVMDQIALVLDPKGTDDAYWWLVVYGVFRFKDIDRWWDNRAEPRWKDSVGRSEVSERGKMLILKLSQTCERGGSATARTS